MKRPKPCADNFLSLSLFLKFYQADRSGEKFLVTQISDDEYGDQRTRKRRLLLFYAIFHATTSRNTFSSKFLQDGGEKDTARVLRVTVVATAGSSSSKNPANVSFSPRVTRESIVRDRTSNGTERVPPIVITCRLTGNILSGCRCFQ